MSIDLEFLAILRCPESGVKLGEASEQQLATVNEHIRAGAVKTRSGTSITEPLGSALVTVDGQRMFQMMGDIPNLVIDDAIDLNLG